MLGAIVLTALCAWVYRSIERRRAAQAFAYSNLAFVREALHAPRWPAVALLAALLIGTGALGLALAGPRFVARVPTKDGTVMLCIDTSGSMRARDLNPTRWDAAKAAARAFIDAVPPGTRVGIVSFASGANVISPPSADLDAVREALDRIPIPNGATAIGDALEVAAAQMPARGRRAIVLLTDGVNNRGVDPVVASQEIGSRGITIATVGVGTNDSGELIPGTSELAQLDEDTLRAIAGNGRGRYARAGDAAVLSREFQSLAFDTVWDSKRIDGSLPFALGGGVLVLATFLTGLALGRFP